MSDNKLVKTIVEAATLTGFTAGIGWVAKKVLKENFTSDPSSSAMNYAKFSAVMAGSIALKQYLEDQKILPDKYWKLIGKMRLLHIYTNHYFLQYSSMPELATAVHRVFTDLTNIVLLYHAMHLIHDYFSDVKEEHEEDEEVCKELYEICVKHRKKFLHLFGKALKKLWIKRACYMKQFLLDIDQHGQRRNHGRWGVT